MRRLLLAPAAVLLVVGAGGSASAAVSSDSVAGCLSNYARVSTVSHAPATGLVGPVVRARFRDGTEVRAWFYVSPAAARAARPVGTFNWNATRENVGYVWNQKPSLIQRIRLKFCITPPSAMASTPVATSTIAHAPLVTRGGRAGKGQVAVQIKKPQP
jgi:hypothetical protein